MEPKNIPFKGKRISTNGEQLMPDYFNEFLNRRDRRAHLHATGGSKSWLYVTPNGKYRTYLQRVFDKVSKTYKTIKHAITL